MTESIPVLFKVTLPSYLIDITIKKKKKKKKKKKEKRLKYRKQIFENALCKKFVNFCHFKVKDPVVAPGCFALSLEVR